MSSLETRFCPRCRLALAPQEAVCSRDGEEGVIFEPITIPAEVLERFDVVEPYARGDSGALFLADEKSTHRRGLLKLMWPEITQRIADRARLRRDLLRLTTLQHAAVVTPYVVGEVNNYIWFFRPWVDGVSLEVKLSRTPNIPISEAIHIATQVTDGLEALHHAGLFHRNLKAGHILLTPQATGYPKVSIIDACVFVEPHFFPSKSKHHDVHDSIPPSVSRPRTTPEAMVWRQLRTLSPEQIDGKLTTFRSDLYALGSIIYEMVEQRPLFRHTNAAAWLEAHASETPEALEAQLNPELKKTILSLLAKEGSERPFAAQHVRRVLSPFVTDATNPDREVTHEFFTPAGGIPRKSLPLSLRAAQNVDANGLPVGTLRPSEPIASMRPSGLGTSAQSKESSPPPVPRPSQIPKDQTVELSGLFEVATQPSSPPHSLPPPVPEQQHTHRALSDDDNPFAHREFTLLKRIQSHLKPAWVAAFAAGAAMTLLLSWCKSPPDTSKAAVKATAAATQVQPEAHEKPVLEKAALPTTSVKTEAAPTKQVEIDKSPEPQVTTEVEALKPQEPERAPTNIVSKSDKKSTFRASRKEKRGAHRPSSRSAASTRANDAFEDARQAARDAFKAKEYRKAVAYYEKAGKLQPKNSGVWAGLAASHYATADYQKAASAYQKASKLAPKSVNLWIALAQSYAASGQKSAAAQAYRTALKLDPYHSTAKTALARLQ